MQYTFIDKPEDLCALMEDFAGNGIRSLAVDFEEESNLHRYGEHLCTIQIHDGSRYWLVDAWTLSKTQPGRDAIKAFIESDIEKIIFDCCSDSALIRKALGFQLENVFDLRIIAKAFEFMGNLTALVQRNLHIDCEDPKLKQRYQRTDWTRRPLTQGQIEYALSDVTYLFDLKQSLLQELSAKPNGFQRTVLHSMKDAGKQKHPEKPGWQKICNWTKMGEDEKVYIKHFFIARDTEARKADVPASNILEKQTIVAMARKGTWEGSIPESKARLVPIFEKARLDAIEEISQRKKR